MFRRLATFKTSIEHPNIWWRLLCFAQHTRPLSRSFSISPICVGLFGVSKAATSPMRPRAMREHFQVTQTKTLLASQKQDRAIAFYSDGALPTAPGNLTDHAITDDHRDNGSRALTTILPTSNWLGRKTQEINAAQETTASRLRHATKEKLMHSHIAISEGRHTNSWGPTGWTQCPG